MMRSPSYPVIAPPWSLVGHQGGEGRSALLLALAVAFCKAASAFHSVVAEHSITPGHVAQSCAPSAIFRHCSTCSGRSAPVAVRSVSRQPWPGPDLNQYQGGMCISGRLTMTERTPRHLISPLGPNWVGTDSAV